MKYKTNARKAEEKINELMKWNSNIPISWSYLEGRIETIILETTIEELPLYLNLENYLRPGYSCDSAKWKIPTLFAKVNYHLPTNEDLIHNNQLTTLLYDDSTFNQFYYEHSSINSIEELEEKFSFLKVPYQHFLLSEVKELISCYQDYFISKKEQPSKQAIFQSINNINVEVFQLYNNCDLQFHSPKLIFNLSGRLLSFDEVIALLFLNKIGIDIIIINNKGNADIENYISKEFLNIYYCDKPIIKQPVNDIKIKVKKYIVGFIVSGIILTTGSLVIDGLQGIGDETILTEDIPNIPVDDNVLIDPGATNIEATSQIPKDYNLGLFTRFKANYLDEGLKLTKVVPDKDIYKHILFIRTIESNRFEINTELYPNIYIFNAEYNNGNSKAGVSKKFIIDGSRDIMKLSAGKSYLIDLIQNDEDEVISRITDQYYNNVIFFKRGQQHFYEHPILIEITNKDTNLKQMMRINRTGMDLDYLELEDGRYSINLLDQAPQNMFDVQLRTNDYIIKGSKLYYDRDRNEPVRVIDDELVFYCNLGDIFIIDCKQIFTDDDNDEIFYFDSLDRVYYFSHHGFNEHQYFNKITSNENLSFSLFATDMYGKVVEKKIHIKVVEQPLD